MVSQVYSCLIAETVYVVKLETIFDKFEQTCFNRLLQLCELV